MARLRSWNFLIVMCCLGVCLCFRPLAPSLANFAADAIGVPPSTAPAQVAAPPAPDPSDSASQLEAEGDDLRAEKRFLDALDYYNAALAKQPSALLWNKQGMSYLMLQHPDKAAKSFDHAIKFDKKAPEGYNNRGYIEQMKKRYDKAIKYYWQSREPAAYRCGVPVQHRLRILQRITTIQRPRRLIRRRSRSTPTSSSGSHART